MQQKSFLRHDSTPPAEVHHFVLPQKKLPELASAKSIRLCLLLNRAAAIPASSLLPESCPPKAPANPSRNPFQNVSSCIPRSASRFLQETSSQASCPESL